MKHVFFLLILCTCTLLGITACNDDLPNELIEIQLNKEDEFWRPKIDEHQLVVIDNREAYNELVGISDVNINFRKYALVLIKGTSPNRIYKLNADILEKANDSYILYINVDYGAFIQFAFEEWFRSYLVPQGIADKIELNISYLNKEQ